MEPESTPRPIDEVIADAVRFRGWVESRQKNARRIIVAETRPGEGFEPEPMPQLRRERIDPEPPPGPRPQVDPMWDDLLDGLGI